MKHCYSDAIFLNDESIQGWERPVEEGSVQIHRYKASIEVVEYIGVDNMEENLGEYSISATAVKYAARVQKIHTETGLIENPNPAEDCVFFSGSVTVLKGGIIPGTDLKGWTVARIGKIWTAEFGVPYMKKHGSLKKLILGDKPDDRARIEGILLGYEQQEDAENKEKEELLATRRRSSTWGWR